jgi:Tfp pilus assembly protein PilF
MVLKKSKNAWHFLNQGLIAAHYNQFKKAISYFNKAILLEPENNLL